jgi:membrane protease YdiL (CAAX protease family)
MIGILVQLAISWILIWVAEKRNLSVLGFWPARQRLTDFILFFLITTAFCASGFLMKMYFGKQHWQLNPDLSAGLVLNGIWWNIKSVLFEELIFRGVLLYILIKKLGGFKAIIISACAFGIYHWFCFGVIGNPLQMAIVFIITGIMGLVLAYSYSKTFSLYISIGIHLGWNLTQIFIFSGGQIGNGLFISADSKQFKTDSYFIFFMVTFLPLLLAILINYLIIRKMKQAETNATPKP